MSMKCEFSEYPPESPREMDCCCPSCSVVKYLARHRHKDKGKIDLLKALDYLCEEMRSSHSYAKEEIEEVIGRHFGKWK